MEIKWGPCVWGTSECYWSATLRGEQCILSIWWWDWICGLVFFKPHLICQNTLETCLLHLHLHLWCDPKNSKILYIHELHLQCWVILIKRIKNIKLTHTWNHVLFTRKSIAGTCKVGHLSLLWETVNSSGLLWGTVPHCICTSFLVFVNSLLHIMKNL